MAIVFHLRMYYATAVLLQKLSICWAQTFVRLTFFGGWVDLYSGGDRVTNFGWLFAMLENNECIAQNCGTVRVLYQYDK